MEQPDFDKARREAAELPIDPVNDLLGAANQLHEAFSSWVEVGFSDSQAMYLTGCALVGNPGIAPA